MPLINEPPRRASKPKTDRYARMEMERPSSTPVDFAFWRGVCWGSLISFVMYVAISTIIMSVW